MSLKSIPTRDADFDVEQKILTDAASLNATKWGLDVNFINGQLKPAQTAWNTKWAKYKDPTTRTSQITFEKTEARKAYEHLLRLLIRDLEYNTRVTDDDRHSMGIHIPDTRRTPINPPTTHPVFSIETAGDRHLNVAFRDHESGSKAKPYGVNGAVIIYDVLDTPPADYAQLTRSLLATRTPHTLEFTIAERGKPVYVAVCWQNEKGQKGPWSEILSSIVP